MTERNAVKEAVETIARLDEARNLRSSPFHLQACGGCGVPSFQQPCLLCGYYPMGADKGTWNPKTATFEQFSRMIEKSGPDGRGGNVATWHARYRAERERNDVETAVEQAAKADVPSAAAVWEAVSVGGASVLREIPPAHVLHGWRGLEEARSLVEGEIGPGAPRLQEAMTDALRAWVKAVHAEDLDGIAACIEKSVELCSRIRHACGKSGNLGWAVEGLRKAADRIPSEKPPRP